MRGKNNMTSTIAMTIVSFTQIVFINLLIE